MTQGRSRYKFPKSARIVSSDDFGAILRSDGPGVIRLGRDSVSLCAQAHLKTGRVRFGFTVGKRNVPLSVDRALVKRILREVARHSLPVLAERCSQLGVGLDVSLRWRTPLRTTGVKVAEGDAKALARRSASLCLKALEKRLDAAAGAFLAQASAAADE